MSENKGTYVFNHKLLDKRLKELQNTPVVPANLPMLRRLSELAIELSSLAEALLTKESTKPTYTDEEVRELARHLNAVIKTVESDPNRTYGYTAVSDAREFLERKKYFNLNQSDLIV